MPDSEPIEWTPSRIRQEAAGCASNSPERLLLELEERHARLRAESAALEAWLQELHTAPEICALCGGTRQRWVRGGMYGELQERSCPCDAEGSAANNRPMVT